MRFPERWTLLRAGEEVRDPSTGNYIPTDPIELPWTGILQKRNRQTDTAELDGGTESNELILMLAPGISVNRRDVLRFDGPADVSDIVSVGDTVTVQGTPRVRRPARGSRRPAYIAAIVRHSSDLKE